MPSSTPPTHGLRFLAYTGQRGLFEAWPTDVDAEVCVGQVKVVGERAEATALWGDFPFRRATFRGSDAFEEACDWLRVHYHLWRTTP